MSMFTQQKRVTRIKGLSDVRRLPRIGKIRLGVKKVAKSGKEYPAEVPWFVCPDEVCQVCGPEPTGLDIMLPVEDPEIIFPQALKLYGGSGRLKCRGDGETATYLDEKTQEMTERECPCEELTDGQCSQVASLLVLLPTVPCGIGGVYQIDTRSKVNIIEINSNLDYIRAVCGRIAMIPLRLTREEQKVQGPDGRMGTHYLLHLRMTDETIRRAIHLEDHPRKVQFMLEPPREESGPPPMPAGVVDEEDVRGRENGGNGARSAPMGGGIPPSPSTPASETDTKPAAEERERTPATEVDGFAPPPCPRCNRPMEKEIDADKDTGEVIAQRWVCGDRACGGVIEIEKPEQGGGERPPNTRHNAGGNPTPTPPPPAPAAPTAKDLWHGFWKAARKADAEMTDKEVAQGYRAFRDNLAGKTIRDSAQMTAEQIERGMAAMAAGKVSFANGEIG